MTDTALMLNLLLRGAATGVLVLIASVLWRERPRTVAAGLGAGFAISVAAATLASTPGFAGAPQDGRIVLAAVAAGSMFVFWLFTRALFDDGFALRPWHAVTWAALAVAGAAQCLGAAARHPQWGPGLQWTLGAMPVVWALLSIGQSLASWREDLVEGRRQLRTLVVATTALYTVAQLLAALLSGLPIRAVVESTANAGGTVVLALFVAWRLLRADQGGLFGAKAPPTLATEHPAGDAEPVVGAARAATAAPPDAGHVATLEQLMTGDHLYREPSLSIGALATRMALPEHRLRRLINQGLGHRNFSAFLNTYRLADARRWLADAAQADTPILTIAMDAGFQSIGPFNRAFKADTGVTPSEFRRLGGQAPGARPPIALAESEIG